MLNVPLMRRPVSTWLSLILILTSVLSLRDGNDVG